MEGGQEREGKGKCGREGMGHLFSQELDLRDLSNLPWVLNRVQHVTHSTLPTRPDHSAPA